MIYFSLFLRGIALHAEREDSGVRYIHDPGLAQFVVVNYSMERVCLFS
jgi:hypothetical protein